MALTPTQTRALLAAAGLVPLPRLGQNFLVDGNIVRKSLALAALAPGDVVVEIGPGLGTLSGALLAAGAEVFAVEISRPLERHLRETLGAAHAGQFHLLEGDGVAHPRADLPPEHPAARTGTFKVVANLPYAICTPWLDALLEGPLPERMVLMLQREAAARFTAAPGTAERGAISVFAEAAYARAPGHAVSRQSFYPVPGVDSELLCLVRRADARQFAPATKHAIRALFTQRRKQLGARARRDGAFPALRPWLERLPAHGLDFRARPEEVPLAAWLDLDTLARKQARAR